MNKGREGSGDSMERRRVELDFTPLLDITLIVIFFFVIFCRLDADENEARVEVKIGELAAAIEEAERILFQLISCSCER